MSPYALFLLLGTSYSYAILLLYLMKIVSIGSNKDSW